MRILLFISFQTKQTSENLNFSRRIKSKVNNFNKSIFFCSSKLHELVFLINKRTQKVVSINIFKIHQFFKLFFDHEFYDKIIFFFFSSFQVLNYFKVIMKIWVETFHSKNSFINIMNSSVGLNKCNSAIRIAGLVSVKNTLIKQVFVIYPFLKKYLFNFSFH